MRTTLKNMTRLMNPTREPRRSTSPDAVPAAELIARLRTEREAKR